MKKLPIYLPWAVLALIALLAAACTPAQSAAQPAAATAAVAAQETFSDPFLYCASTGNIDQPDARYTGEKVPDAVIQGFIKAAGLTGTTEPSDMFKKATVWRCMDKKVYACNFGANLPCESKANTNKTPTQAMADFCKANQNADFIPMAVTGHDTVYSWHCVKDAPEVLDQISQVDAAGYIANIWYPIEKTP